MASKNTEFVLNSPRGLLKQFVSPSGEEWYKNIEYDDVKDLIRENFGKAAESFIAIGYYLKYVKENELYKKDNYDNIWDFALHEFNLTQGTASRYMSMNTKFSKYGNSPVLADDYKNFNKSQLQELLPMKEEELKEALEDKTISSDMTVKEIREINNKRSRELTEVEKKEYDELTKQAEQITINNLEAMDITEVEAQEEKYATSHKINPSETEAYQLNQIMVNESSEQSVIKKNKFVIRCEISFKEEQTQEEVEKLFYNALESIGVHGYIGGIT